MTDHVFLQQTNWDFPVPIKYGPGRLRDAGALCLANGCQNPLIVADRATGRLPFVDKLRGILSGAALRHGSFTAVSPNPTDTEVMAGKAAFWAGGHDSIIALGGGSGMDAGKAISLVLNTDRDLWDRRDSSTPVAMVDLLKRIYRGELISTESRNYLLGLMARCETGKNRRCLVGCDGRRRTRGASYG